MTGRLIPVLWVLQWPWFHGAFGDANYIKHANRLYHDLFDDYVPIRPATSLNQSVNVSLHLSLQQVTSLMWTDPSLTWNGSEYGGIEDMAVSAESVWTPVVGLRNSADRVINPDWKKYFPVHFMWDGRVGWGPMGSFRTTCSLNLFRFPFDTQECCLKFGNIVNDEAYVNLSSPLTYVNLDHLLEGTEFSVIGNSTGFARDSYEFEGILTVPVVSFCLTLKRRPAYYVLNVIIPTSVLAFLPSLIFYVPVEAGEKVSLAITILLSFSVFALMLSENTPPTDAPFPFLGCYLTVTVSLSSLSMMVQLVTLRMYYKSDGPVCPPGWLVKFASCLSRCLGRKNDILVRDTDMPSAVSMETEIECQDLECTAAEDQQEIVKDKDRLLQEVTKISDFMKSTTNGEAYKAEWKKIAKILDTFFLILFAMVQMIMIVIAFIIIPFS